MSSPRIAVVGAGMAGLAAAHRLLAGGAEVALVERAALGGRAQEILRDGFRVERAPLLVGARDASLHALGAQLPSADRLPLLRPVAPAQLHGGAICEIDASDSAGLRRLPGIPLRGGFRLLRLERLLRRFAPLLAPDHPERATRLDDRSVADFTRLYFGEAALAHWAEPRVVADLGLLPEHTSRAALLRHHVGRGEIGLGRLRTGVGALGAELTRAAERVAGDVRGIRAEGERYELALAGGGRVEAEAVVLALPPLEALGVAADLSTAAEVDVLAASAAEAAIVASFACDGALAPHAIWARVPAQAGAPLASIALEPGAPFGFAPEGQTLVQVVATPQFSRAHLEAGDDVLARALAAALERARPGASRTAAPLDVARFAWARPRFDVGRYRALAAFARVQSDRCARGRRLYFAGDWRVSPTLEGAASSGLRAASAALRDLGVEDARGARTA